MKDGWHLIAGCRVLVENGFIKRGTKGTPPLGEVAAYVYRKVGTGWGREDGGVTPAAFRSGLKRGTIALL